VPNELVILDSQSNQVKKEVFEEMFRSALCVASRYGGLGWISFPRFLEEIVRELTFECFSLDKAGLSSIFTSYPLSFLAGETIPFLSLVDSCWPQAGFQTFLVSFSPNKLTQTTRIVHSQDRFLCLWSICQGCFFEFLLQRGLT
jgi:hypothetical protein